MRLEACPSGYVLVRNQERPDFDEFVKCPAQTYMIQASSYKEGKGVSTSAAVLQKELDLCLLEVVAVAKKRLVFISTVQRFVTFVALYFVVTS